MGAGDGKEKWGLGMEKRSGLVSGNGTEKWGPGSKDMVF